MKDFRSRQEKTPSFFESSFSSFLLLLALVGFITFLAFSVHRVFQKENKVVSERQKITDEVDRLRKRRDALQKQIDFLNTKEGVIEEYKKHYNVAPPGEGIIKIVHD